MEKRKRKIKIGLALGGGSAKGIAHIGVLKVLNQHGIYPDLIAGTSIGAVIGAIYAAGHTPEEMEEIAKTTDWQEIIDFTVPKAGLVKGQQIENKIKKLVYNKNFSELKVPLRVVAVNLNTKETSVLSKGNVAKAVHASMAIPGIFNPVKIKNDYYIDGGWAEPTPFEVIKEMGADLTIAVDLSHELGIVKGPQVQETTFLDEIKKKFIAEELLNLKHYLTPKMFPRLVIRLFEKLFDKILYPSKILKFLAKRNRFPLLKIYREADDVLYNNLAKERLKNAKVDFLIKPGLGNLVWSDFHKIEEFVKIGEKAAKKIIPELEKKIRSLRAYG